MAVSEQDINDRNFENIKTMLYLGGGSLRKGERSSGAQNSKDTRIPRYWLYLMNQETEWIL